MSSVTAVVIVLIATIVIYAGVIFLSRAHNHGGRDSVDPLYSVSQWNPEKFELTHSCVIPTVPGQCVIEGFTGAYQQAKHWCDLPGGAPCIDPNTGENVKNNPIPFLVTCAHVPF